MIQKPALGIGFDQGHLSQIPDPEHLIADFDRSIAEVVQGLERFAYADPVFVLAFADQDIAQGQAGPLDSSLDVLMRDAE